MKNKELQWVESVHILRNFIYWVVRRNEMLRTFYYNIFKDIQGMFNNKCIWTAFHYPGTTFSDIFQTDMNKETVNFLDAYLVLHQNWKVDKDKRYTDTNTHTYSNLQATI